MNPIKNNLEPKVFSIFLVEDDINPINIFKVFNRIFGSSSNYELENARSVFNAFLKLNYCLNVKDPIYFNLYIFDVRLVEKEGKGDFPLGFPDDNELNEKLEDFYGRPGGFFSYATYCNLKIDAYEEFKKTSGIETDEESQEQGGLNLWSYFKNKYPIKFRSAIYSASPKAAADAKWMDKKSELYVLQKSLFDDNLVSDTFDIFRNEIERLSRGRPVKIFQGGKEIQSYDKFTNIPMKEEELLNNKGFIIDFHNKDIKFRNKPNHLEIYINEKKEGSKLQHDYTDLMNILELCSNDIVNDTNESILWDNITDVDVDIFTTEKDILDFLENKLPVSSNKEYWTLRTLFPAQCYRVINIHKDDLEAQKKELKELIAKYGWIDYSEAFSIYFNQGAVYIRAHSLDKHFSSENPNISSTDIRSPFNKDEIIDNPDIFKKVWEHQYRELTLKISNTLDKKKFKHKTEKKKELSWKDIIASFQDYKNKNLKNIRDNYLDYTTRELFDIDNNGRYFLKGSGIPVEVVEGVIDKIRLFFPGTNFLDFIEEIKNDHINKKKRGEVKKCDIKITYTKNTDIDIYIMSFILLVEDWKQIHHPPKEKVLDFSLITRFNGSPLLKNFIRFNIILTNADGNRQIFNINNNFPIDPTIRELKIKSTTIMDIDREYTDKDEIYVLSVTSSDLLKISKKSGVNK